MSKLPILIPARDCEKSPSNVRKSSDPAADLQFKANIAVRGIIQNLIGVPVPRKKGQYRIIAGGRRLDTVQSLIADGTFAPDYAIPVLVLGDAKDAIEISLSENFFKLDMNPADACCAFQDIIAIEKKTPADVAKRFGLTERFVLGRLRLAGLAEPVFDALRAGAITLDIAMAYASTADVQRQANIFDELTGTYYADNANEIRRRLTIGDYLGNDPKALLVGREAYIAAGGQTDCDLFSTSQTERWTSGDILERLADERLKDAAASLQATQGYAQVRTVASTRVPYMETLHLSAIEGEPVALSPEEEERQRAIEAELETINDNCSEEGYTDEEDARVRALEAEYALIEEKPPLILDEHRAGAIAYLVIGADGVPRLHDEIYALPAEVVGKDDDADGAGVGLDARDADDEEAEDPEADEPEAARPPISQRLRDELATMKVEVVKAHVASEIHFAFDLAIFLMAETATRRWGNHDLPSELRAFAPSPRVQGFESGAAAAEHWATLEAALDQGWTEGKTVPERYDAFCALDEGARSAWLGWAVARTLRAVPAGERGADMIDHLGRKLEIDMAAWWRPTARTYFDRVSKATILDLFGEMGGSELKSRYGASKKHDLATSAEKLFAGQIIIEADVKDKALAWLPPEMRLGNETPPPEAAVAAADASADATGATSDGRDISQAA
ncbi:MAG: chromosome partitioning protein ParB [Sphingobium sp.]|nr:chromosome partitioning protein ParB [Sphingobium sp.]